jgi:hypothetical protein
LGSWGIYLFSGDLAMGVFQKSNNLTPAGVTASIPTEMKQTLWQFGELTFH